MREHSNLQMNYFSKRKNVLIEAGRYRAVTGQRQETLAAAQMNAQFGRQRGTNRKTSTSCVSARICNELGYIELMQRKYQDDSLLEFGAQFTNSNDLGDLRDAFSLHLHDIALNPAQSATATAGAEQGRTARLQRTRSLYTRWGSLTMRHISPLAGKREYGSSMRTCGVRVKRLRGIKCRFDWAARKCEDEALREHEMQTGFLLASQRLFPVFFSAQSEG